MPNRITQPGSMRWGVSRLSEKRWAQQQIVFLRPTEIGNIYSMAVPCEPEFDGDTQETFMMDGNNAVLFARAKSTSGGSVTLLAPSRIIEGVTLRDITYTVGIGLQAIAIENSYTYRDGFMRAQASNVCLRLFRPSHMY